MHEPVLLPAPVGALLGRLPRYPGARVFVAGLNLVLAQQIAPDVAQMLLGKALQLRVIDAQIAFDFAWRDGQFVAQTRVGEPDLTISASAYDFHLLARRLEDPDTLFFSRRLAMQGDTELGLMVKNTLDAMEFPLLQWSDFAPSQVFARWKSGLRSGAGKT